MSENIQWKHLVVPANIRADSKTAVGQLAKIARSYFADESQPFEFTCKQCKVVTPEAHMHSEWKTATCSNCYSERMYVSKVRLTYYNWGEHNGGDAELIDRHETGRNMLLARTLNTRTTVRDEGSANAVKSNTTEKKGS